MYKHTSPSGKIYIGITSQTPERRWLSGHGYKHTYFGNAIQKYGWENIEHEILFTGLEELEAKEKEVELIEKYKSYDREYGYNCTKGGDGTVGLKCSKEQIQYLKDLLGKPVYQRDLNGALIKKWSSIREIERELGVARSNIQLCCGGKTYQAYGFFWSHDKEQMRYKRNRKDCKQVYQYDLDGNLVKEWESLSIIQETLGYPKNNLSHCCLGKYPSAYGFIWSYEKKDKIQYVNKNIQKQRKVYQLTKDMKIIKEWANLEEVATILNYKKSVIGNCCRCKSKTAYGYIWRYEETLNNKVSLVSAQAKRVLQLDKEYILIAEYESVSEAQRATGINNISNCCNGKYKTAGGYIWKYANDLEK